ncbi:MAG: response regulator transcription factor [Hyphomicrobiaceae bacterium]
MILIVDDREIVSDGYRSSFSREGFAAEGLAPYELSDWVESASAVDINSVEAFLLGNFDDRSALSQLIRRRTKAAVIALSDDKSLDDTLNLFASGFDDVVNKPIHVREIIARINAIRRRASVQNSELKVGEITVFADGQDPIVAGEPLPLPRRELRILEYLAAKNGRWATKNQIFSSVYGLFNEDIDENVIESHISKLRKKLRGRLNSDPIESLRFIGYRLVDPTSQT